MLKKNLVKLCVIVCLLVLVPAASAGSDVIESIGKGVIDWEDGVVRVMGYGAPPEKMSKAQAKLATMRAAKADAYRNALEVIEGVRLHSETIVKDFVLESDDILTQVQGFIKGGEFVDIQYDGDGICQATLVYPLTGAKGVSSFFEEKIFPNRPIVEIVPETRVADKVVSQPNPKETSPLYTGVVIDVRGLNVKPAVYSQIFDSNGNLLYGPTLVSPNQGYTTMVAYSRSIEKGKSLPRVGGNPLVIKAVSSIKGKNGEATDIVLDSQSTKAFLDTAKGRIVERAAVVYVID